MAERFGASFNPDGKPMQIDMVKAFTTVGDFVAEEFGFRLHNGIIGGFNTNEYSLLRQTLVQTGMKQEAITEQLGLILTLNALTVSSQAPLIFNGYEIDYALFLNTQTPIISAPGFIAEEIVHAEHTQMLKDKRLTLKDVGKIFHPLTSEFLGYLGRRHLDEAVGLLGGYNGRLRPSGSSKSHFAHYFGYQLLDELCDRNIPLPSKTLFHAQDETILWEYINDALKGEAILISVPIPMNPNIDLDRVVENAEETIREAKAESIIKPAYFSISSEK